MKEKILATYERESTLWKNANGFYRSTDWVKMECILVDFTEELKPLKSGEIVWLDSNGNDVTSKIIKERYSKPYLIHFTTAGRMNSKSYWFETKEQANDFFKKIMKDKTLGNFKRV